METVKENIVRKSTCRRIKGIVYLVLIPTLTPVMKPVSLQWERILVDDEDDDVATTKYNMLTRKAVAKDMENKLKAALHDLKTSQSLCEKLIQERDESELEIQEIIKKNSLLKAELAELHMKYIYSEDKCKALQDIVDSFQQCSSDHKMALSRIAKLECSLMEVQEDNPKRQCNTPSSLHDELVECGQQELQVPLLITIVGDTTYSLMCDLCSPEHPESKSFEELVRLVTQHLEPQRSEIAERHVFRLRRQVVGEPLTEYLHNLKHLATTCNFGSNLEENLRDQFVSGLASEAMRSRIFAEKDINYKQAVELALALEAAERHAEVSAAPSAAGVGGGGGSAAGEGLHQASVRRSQLRGAARPPAQHGGGGSGAGGGAGGTGRCWRCGRPHRADKCRFANYNCDECGVRGHLKNMCKSVSGKGRANARHNYVSDDERDEEFFNIQVDGTGDQPYLVMVKVDGRPIEFEVDTGSRISTISEDFFRRNFYNKTVLSNNINIRSYVGSTINSLGFINVYVTLGKVSVYNCKLYVIKNGGRPLLGREWVRALGVKNIAIDLQEINEDVGSDPFVSQLMCEFPEVFTEKLGTCKKTITLYVKDEKPVYVRARPVPLALRARVESELARLEREGIIYRVESSDYGTPIVPVVKECGDIRICGDYKITINPILKRDPYPLPRIEELFASLSGGEEYSKIDLKHSYQQCLLSNDSQRYTAITTHVGTFVYRRTPFGLSCIPEKFQKIMEETLRGVPNTVVFLDDVCVTGVDRKSHLRNLRTVLERLRAMGFTVKFEKCSFLQKSI
ncbi:uncharacterized protein LOC123694580 [Colias croceus]|uniref:uncharacterized protein LOC123694580 n=1 Tax=Colias crocea TaxID=72248 RepID=UPI001E27A4DD|nr:uncharacterized protein LOC123694580 [Colias croceus]